ncbi:hypothetical protein Ahy_B05g078932 [Arachis hypogaea]|uniref:PLAC8 family protein n=1 Tax=Arachis hypogaea TaxID=3818 RepID=A0A444Z8L0_ARAHY|nr:hypothetical protein Ahy_B05g078932 [Arachis hypogaea]
MGSQQKLEKMQLRQNYRNFWHTDLMSTIQADAPCNFSNSLSLSHLTFASSFTNSFILSNNFQIAASLSGANFLLSHYSAPCVSYLLRKRALYNDMSRYTCCAGYMPCSGRCGESRCPEFCLCTEVFLCFGNSVASTRFLLQDEFNIQTTQCDNCIIGFMFCLQQIACIFSIVALIVGSDEINEASQLLSCLAEYVYCTVCACMQTQHKIEMDKRDGKFGPQPAMAVPPAQQMSRIEQQVPPSVGYAPQQPYGYPQPGYPATTYPPPPQAYPPAPQAYPPPGYPR